MGISKLQLLLYLYCYDKTKSCLGPTYVSIRVCQVLSGAINNNNAYSTMFVTVRSMVN